VASIGTPRQELGLDQDIHAIRNRRNKSIQIKVRPIDVTARGNADHGFAHHGVFHRSIDPDIERQRFGNSADSHVTLQLASRIRNYFVTIGCKCDVGILAGIEEFG